MVCQLRQPLPFARAGYFTATEEQVVTISLVDLDDGDFDPHLTLIGPDLRTIREDDDSGDGSDGYNALIEQVDLPEEGQYIVVAGREGSSAIYELTIMPNELYEARTLARAGEIVSATLKFEEVLALVPELELDPAAEAKRLYVPILVEEGRGLAQAGEVISATLKFEEAMALDPALEIEPKQEAKRIYAPTVVEEGRDLAEMGVVISATLKFEEALALDPALEIEPEEDAKRLYATVLEEEGRGLAKVGKVISATLKFEEALALDPELEIVPEQEVERLAPRSISIGTPVTSTTAVRTRWLFTGTADEIIAISLVDIDQGSFDPSLTLIGPNGETLTEDDDGGGGHDGYDALIDEFALPEDGNYIVVAGREGSAAVYELLVMPNDFHEARVLAQAGDVISATAQFKEVFNLYPALEINPEQEAKRLYARTIVAEGRGLAEAGQVISATLKFEEALALDPALEIEPEQEIRRGEFVAATEADSVVDSGR